jgi:hypothetical protein
MAFIGLTSPEMEPVFKASGTEKHQRRRENGNLAPFTDEIELFRAQIRTVEAARHAAITSKSFF